MRGNHILSAVVARAALVWAVTALIAAVVLAATLAPCPSAVLLLAVLWWRGRRSFKAGWAFGTARWADTGDLTAAGMLSGHGVVVGRVGPTSQAPLSVRIDALLRWPLVWSAEAVRLFLGRTAGVHSALVRVPKFVHGLVVAPPGKGKSRCLAIPVLLDHPGPVFVLDIKGELFRESAHHRMAASGRAVALIDPFGETGSPADGVNVLDLIDADAPTALDDCRVLAVALVVATGGERDPHWVESARTFVLFALAVVAAHSLPHERHMQTVRDILTDPVRFRQALQQAQASAAMGGLLRRLGYRLTQYVDRELGSVLTTANRALDFLDSMPVAAATAQSTFYFADVVTGCLDLYVVVPPDQLVPQAGLLRLLTACMYLAQTKSGSERTPVLYLLDEIGNLGGLDAVEQALTVGRGYGCRLLLFFQSLAQLKQSFPDKEGVVIACCDTQLFFGITDRDTAALVSARLGQATAVTRNAQASGGTSSSRSVTGQGDSTGRTAGWSRGAAETGRPLLTPDEVTRLPAGVAVLLHRHYPPAAIELVPHDRTPELRRRAGGGWGVLARAVVWAALATVLLVRVVEAVQADADRPPASAPSATKVPPPQAGFQFGQQPQPRPGRRVP